jgi:uncharacterized protein with NAD-binding domain and iron-sulfur cluster
MVGLTNDELIDKASGELLEAMPELRDIRLTAATVVREPRATFSLAVGEPARPSTETPVRGLLLAGDWIDTGLAGNDRERGPIRAPRRGTGTRMIW